MKKGWMLGNDIPVTIPSATCQLCDLGQASCHLWASGPHTQDGDSNKNLTGSINRIKLNYEKKKVKLWI